jgi:RNA polymerase sigma-70 factor (ECF subfamily)
VKRALASASASTPAQPRAAERTDADERIRSLLALHFEFVWRSLRRLGVARAFVDDAAQEVFWVTARKLDRIEPGSERAFLFGVAVRLASDARRRQARTRELSDDALVQAAIDPDADVEVLVDQKRARDLLDVVLETLPFDLRTVLMLSEGERLTMAEIASLLGIAPGTVASRLRRARELFESSVDKLLGARREESVR